MSVLPLSVATFLDAALLLAFCISLYAILGLNLYGLGAARTVQEKSTCRRFARLRKASPPCAAHARIKQVRARGPAAAAQQSSSRAAKAGSRRALLPPPHPYAPPDACRTSPPDAGGRARHGSRAPAAPSPAEGVLYGKCVVDGGGPLSDTGAGRLGTTGFLQWSGTGDAVVCGGSYQCGPGFRCSCRPAVRACER